MVPKDDRVRPTAERVREAWLNILTPAIAGANVIDLYAGSGALGLEALSRGAAQVTFVEKNAPSLAAIRSNIATLAVEAQTSVMRADAIKVVAGLSAGAYDIALADPPFAADDARTLVDHWQESAFARILAVEHSPKVHLPDGDTRRWGDIAVTFYHSL